MATVHDDQSVHTRALAGLDPQARMVLELAIRRRLSDQEIAGRLGLAVGDVTDQREGALRDLAMRIDAAHLDRRRLMRLVDRALEVAPELDPAHARRHHPVARLSPGRLEYSRGQSRADAARRAAAEPAARRHAIMLLGVLALAALVRVWQINSLGLNSDEAVYAGQGASIAGMTDLAPYFPTFRAHPLLFQTLISIGFHTSSPEVFGRCAAAALGVATVWLTYLTGRALYGPRAGLLAALILAVMPYHVAVTRQILLDGPMTFCATLTLYMLVRFAATERVRWLYAAAGAMGLTFLSKETSIILLGAVYAFLALEHRPRVRARHIVGSGVLLGVVISAFPLSLMLAGASRTGGSFLVWQLFRRPNHSFLFYPWVVPMAIGLLVVAAAVFGLWLLRRDASWRETLLLSWITVPVAFFQIFPVKGFQYLLPIAPAVAILAARFITHYQPVELTGWARFVSGRRAMSIFAAMVIVSIAVPTWQRVQPSKASTFLAGSGGLPGGRDAGRWIGAHVPVGARFMTVGPSMANVLQYYGKRKMYGLSVSPNPLHRNPVYEAMKNPDRLIRDNELQYVVWDAFSAKRTPFFTQKLLRYVERYNGTVAHSETVPVRTRDGGIARKPIITIYEVRP